MRRLPGQNPCRKPPISPGSPSKPSHKESSNAPTTDNHRKKIAWPAVAAAAAPQPKNPEPTQSPPTRPHASRAPQNRHPRAASSTSKPPAVSAFRESCPDACANLRAAATPRRRPRQGGVVRLRCISPTTPSCCPARQPKAKSDSCSPWPSKPPAAQCLPNRDPALLGDRRRAARRPVHPWAAAAGKE